MKTVCVYCGSNQGFDKIYTDKTIELINQFSSRGINLVYGGASVGLMGTAADFAIKSGVKITGVIPEYIDGKGITRAGLDELIIADDMRGRKKIMENLSDGFIALPGGFGTLDEFFEALTLLQLGIHAKPCALYNINGYFDKLLGFLGHCADEGFIKKENIDMLIIDDDPSKLLDRMINFKRPPVDKWIRDKK